MNIYKVHSLIVTSVYIQQSANATKLCNLPVTYKHLKSSGSKVVIFSNLIFFWVFLTMLVAAHFENQVFVPLS